MVSATNKKITTLKKCTDDDDDDNNHELMHHALIIIRSIMDSAAYACHSVMTREVLSSFLFVIQFDLITFFVVAARFNCWEHFHPVCVFGI